MATNQKKSSLFLSKGGGACQGCQRVGVSGQCGMTASELLCACWRSSDQVTCRIGGESLVRETSLIGCSGEQTSTRKKAQKQRGRVPEPVTGLYMITHF